MIFTLEQSQLIVGSVITLAAAVGAFLKARTIEKQVRPKNGTDQSLSSMLHDLMHQTADLMRQVGHLGERLTLHDQRQMENAKRVQNIEKVLNDHLEDEKEVSERLTRMESRLKEL